jgi:hypothetical protein
MSTEATQPVFYFNPASAAALAQPASRRVRRIQFSVLLLDALQTASRLPDWRETAPAHMPEPQNPTRLLALLMVDGLIKRK